MPTNGSYLPVDGDLVRELEAALGRLETTGEELVLDFGPVRHIQPSALGALEALARAAEAKRVRVSLTGVGIDLYRVLKLVNLTARFTFPG